MRRRSVVAIVCLGLVTLSGCSSMSSDAASAGARIVDSAGVRVIEYDQDRGIDEFMLRGPVRTLGEGDGTEFQRLVSALRTARGLAVAADGRRELMYFDDAGGPVRIIGRSGAGPGEFRELRSLHRRGRDSIVVYDGRQFRISIFTERAFARSIVVMRSSYMPHITAALVGMLPLGETYFRGGATYAIATSGPPRVERETWPLVAYREDGTPRELVMQLQGMEHEITPIRVGPLRGKGYQRGRRIFGVGTAVGFVRGEFAVVNTATLGFEVYSLEGRLQRKIRMRRAPVPVAAEHVASYVEDRLGRIKDEETRAELEKDYAELDAPETFPFLDVTVVVDAVERIWLAEYVKPGDQEQVWWIFTRDGARIGRVSVPTALRVVDAGSDFLIGIWRDGDGVESVREYRLVSD